MDSLLQHLPNKAEADELIKQALWGLAKLDNQDIFEFITLQMSAYLGTDFAMISSIDSNGVANTITVCMDGKQVDNFDYELAFTPCEKVVNSDERCFYGQGVQCAFPKDILLSQMGIESYIGSPLIDSQQSVIGILIVMSRRPIHECEFVDQIFSVYLSRAAMELERLLNRQKLALDEAQYHQLFNSAKDAILVIDKESYAIHDCNLVGRQWFTHISTKLKQNTLLSLVHNEGNRRALLKVLRQVQTINTEPQMIDVLFDLDGGKTLQGELSISTLPSENNGLLLVYIHDVTQKRKEQARLEWISSIPEQNPNPVMRVNDKGYVLYKNPAANSLFNDAEKQGESLLQTLVPEPMLLIEQAAQPTVIELSVGKQNYLFHRVPVPGKDYINVYGVNISDRVIIEEKNKQLARYDSLTDVANRWYFCQQLDDALKAIDSEKKQLALLLIDIDDFKQINDTLGHQAGDELLKQSTQRILLCLTSEHVLGRFGGDEFVVYYCLDKENSLSPKALALRIKAMFELPFNLLGYAREVKSSIGVSVSLDKSTTRQALFQQADLAMYKAKACGKNTVQCYSEKLQFEYEQRQFIEEGLKASDLIEQLSLVYQPQYALSTNELVGVEVLVRWNEPSKGVIQPEQFILIAEQIGCIERIGYWVFEHACRNYIQTVASHFPNIKLSINVSPKQLALPHFVSDVEEILNKTSMPAEHLVLEITETSLMENIELATTRIQQLQALGLAIAIDDFGTGYSSLSRICHLSISYLKIDKSFLDGWSTDRTQASVLNTILNLSNSIGAISIQEGVETKEQLDFVKKAGCHCVQGFYFQPPLSLVDLVMLAN